MVYYAVERSSYLQHYGVLGMKWGIRRYQDYDGHKIGSKRVVKREHDAAVKRMNVKHYSSTRNTDNEVYFQNATKNHPIEKLSELERYDQNSDIRKLRYQINSDKDAGYGRHYNCPNCAAAFEMVERGYSVTAREKPDGSNVEDIESFFKNGKLQTAKGSESIFERYGIYKLGKDYSKAQDALDKYKDELPKKYTKDQLVNNPDLVRKENTKYAKIKTARDEAYHKVWDTMNKACDEVKKKTLSELKTQGDGARGIMVIGWDNGDPTRSGRTNSYHAFNYKVENDKVKFYDAQSHKEWSQNGGVDHSFFIDADPRDVYYMRTDTLELSENITQAVYSNKRKGVKEDES